MPAAVSVIVILVLLAVFTAGGFYLRFRTYEKIGALLDAGKVDEAGKRLDGVVARSVLAPFARERLRFRALAQMGDRTNLVQQMNLLMKMKLNANERSVMLADGFNAFAQLGDYKHCKRIVEKMASAGFTDKALAAYQRHFDIVLAHKTEGWKALENTYATLSGKRRGYVAYLLSKVHETLHDGEAAAYGAEAARLYGMPESELDRRINVNTSL